MRIDVLTLFPGMLEPMLNGSILGRARSAGLIDVRTHDIREYTRDRHKRTDDYPFGGGAGMVMFPQPICDAIRDCDPDHRARRIYMSPRGRTLTQKLVEELGREENLLILCGHYEGVDQRVLDSEIDEELSVGDYVLTGGELGALIVIDSVSRMVPGVLGCAESGEDESFSMGLLEYPQYTRPAVYEGQSVPQVLLGGNHADIVAWRREQSLLITLERRPELIETAPLTDEDKAMLERIRTGLSARDTLRAMGYNAERAEDAEAMSFPKEWLARFVPEANRKAAKKQCISGRRHIGYLSQAFSMGLASCAEEPVEFSGMKLVYLQDAQVLLRTDAPVSELPFSHATVTDTDMTKTVADRKYSAKAIL